MANFWSNQSVRGVRRLFCSCWSVCHSNKSELAERDAPFCQELRLERRVLQSIVFWALKHRIRIYLIFISLRDSQSNTSAPNRQLGFCKIFSVFEKEENPDSEADSLSTKTLSVLYFLGEMAHLLEAQGDALHKGVTGKWQLESGNPQLLLGIQQWGANWFEMTFSEILFRFLNFTLELRSSVQDFFFLFKNINY